MFTRIRTTLAAAAVVAALALAAGPVRAQQLYSATANPRADIAAALAQARTDHKLVLLDFGADWCLDCVILDRLFQHPAVQPYLAEHFHVVRVYIGQFDTNLDVARKYGNVIEGGVPAAVVLAPGGMIVANTRNGSLESARRMTPQQLRQMLEQWVARAAAAH